MGRGLHLCRYGDVITHVGGFPVMWGLWSHHALVILSLLTELCKEPNTLTGSQGWTLVE